MALHTWAVSQLLVELRRTLKGQNGVEFDLQSFLQHYSSRRHTHAGLLGCKVVQIEKNKVFT